MSNSNQLAYEVLSLRRQVRIFQGLFASGTIAVLFFASQAPQANEKSEALAAEGVAARQDEGVLKRLEAVEKKTSAIEVFSHEKVLFLRHDARLRWADSTASLSVVHPRFPSGRQLVIQGDSSLTDGTGDDNAPTMKVEVRGLHTVSQ